MNATHEGAVAFHVVFGSTNAKPSKSISIPSKLFVRTKFMMVSTTCLREAGALRRPANTPFSVPSVIVGMICKFAARIAASGTEIGTLGLAGAYKSVMLDCLVLVEYLSVYQKGITSLMRSVLFSAAGSAVFME